MLKKMISVLMSMSATQIKNSLVSSSIYSGYDYQIKSIMQSYGVPSVTLSSGTGTLNSSTTQSIIDNNNLFIQIGKVLVVLMLWLYVILFQYGDGITIQ